VSRFPPTWASTLLVVLVALSWVLDSWPTLTTAADFRPVGYEGKLIASTARNGRFVALTFDDGPNPTWTPQVLDLLKQHDVHATFCLVGENVDRYPGLVRRIAAEGHQLCDHTVDHDLLTDDSDRHVRDEIVGGLAAIRRAVPKAKVRFYRAPYGAWSAYQIRAAAKAGMRPLSWSINSRDYLNPGVPAILAAIERELQPGGVILMHDAGGHDRSQSVAALRVLLRELPEKGYRFDFPARRP